MIEEKDLGNYKKRISYSLDNIEVAYIEIEEVIDTMNIIDVCTLEEYRRRGIMELLFSYVTCKYRDYRFMLEVRIDNEPAINLYKKFGFKVIHKRKNYYKECDALIMEMR